MKTMLAFAGCSAGMLVAAYLLFSVGERRDYAREGRLSIASRVFGTALFFAWGGLPWIYGPADWPRVAVAVPQAVCGWALLALGVAVMVASVAGLGVSRTLGVRQRALVAKGPYRLSRNPQYVGCMLYAVGFALLWPSWYALVWVLLAAAMVHMLVSTEEEHLSRLLRGDYERYRREVPRYLGF